MPSPIKPCPTPDWAPLMSEVERRWRLQSTIRLSRALESQMHDQEPQYSAGEQFMRNIVPLILILIVVVALVILGVTGH